MAGPGWRLPDSSDGSGGGQVAACCVLRHGLQRLLYGCLQAGHPPLLQLMPAAPPSATLPRAVTNGYTLQEGVALSGAHTLGFVAGTRSMTPTPYAFDTGQSHPAEGWGWMAALPGCMIPPCACRPAALRLPTWRPTHPFTHPTIPNLRCRLLWPRTEPGGLVPQRQRAGRPQWRHPLGKH